jgi:lipooligosaccharide transport system ATP-binding protein
VRNRIGELLEFAQLTDRRDSKVEPLSGGMKRRLTIARGLINRPELMLLDEPTTGLDPQARHVLWDRLYRLKREGVTLIITTHYMDEAEQLCDRLVIMDKGLIVGEGSPRELIERHTAGEVVEVRLEPGTDPSVLEGVGTHQEVLADRVLVSSADAEESLNEVHQRGIVPAMSLIRRATLEDVFLTLTGRTLVD